MTFDIDLDVEHTLDAGPAGNHRVQVWRAICPREEAIFQTSLKCPYRMTFDLYLDLQHTLDAGLPRDHCVHVWWRSSHLPVIRSDFRDITEVPVSRDL